MMDRRYVVRVVVNDGDVGLENTLQLRALLGTLRDSIVVHREDGETLCFDIFAPEDATQDPSVPFSFQTRFWAERTVQELQASGINAVCAPEWREIDDDSKSSLEEGLDG
jgi:hypothetical protein